MNPFRKCTPNGWGESVNWFRFIHEEAYYYGRTGKHEPYSHRWKGYLHLLKQLLPSYYRVDENAWYLTGPQWVTRACGEADTVALFEVCRVNGRWEFRGPERS